MLRYFLPVAFVLFFVGLTATPASAQPIDFVWKSGTQGTAEGQFNGPFGLAVDGSGNVYVSDWGQDRIQKLDSSGTFVEMWGWGVDDGTAAFQICTSGCQAGIGGSGDGQFFRAGDVKVDGAGNVFVAGQNNQRIQKFDSSGTFLTKWGTSGSAEGQFLGGMAIALDSSGNVYATDNVNNRIQKFDNSGTFLEMWGWGVDDGTAVSQVCTGGCQAGLVGTGDGQFDDLGPNGIAVDASGNVYVTDLGPQVSNRKRIQKFDSSGTFLTKWGTGGTAEGQFQFPQKIAVDDSGNVYVTDQIGPAAVDGARVQKFDSSGAFLAMWGWGVDNGSSAFQNCTSGCQQGISGTGDGQFWVPHGVAVDGSGHVYVSNQVGHNIQKFVDQAAVPLVPYCGDGNVDPGEACDDGNNTPNDGCEADCTLLSFVGQSVISLAADGAQSVHAADVDGDGDIDVLSASTNDDKIAWYENDGTASPNWTPRTISTSADQPREVTTADVDGDGDMDVLSASVLDNKIAWYENDGASPPAWTPRTISTAAVAAVSVFPADVDGDGDMDVLSASFDDDKIAWYENNGASPPSWTPRTISITADGAHSVFAADVDGDGDMDVVSGSAIDNTIAWYENDGASPPVWTPRTISTSASFPREVHAADVDGDGDMDVLSASLSDDTIAWYENDGASPPAWTPHVISVSADVALSVFAADVDGDGDMDVLSASEGDNKIAWYENDGASPPVWTPHTISTAGVGGNSVYAADLDGDGDVDAVSASQADDKIAWYKNRTIHRNAIYPSAVVIDTADGGLGERQGALGDVDGDGDLDLVVPNKVARNKLYLNNGTADPWNGVTGLDITTDEDDSTVALLGDVDGDGDLDLVVTNYDVTGGIGQVGRLYLNDGSGDPWDTVSGIDITTDANKALAAALADLDGDGNLDLVVGNQSESDRLYLNDGDGDPWDTLTNGVLIPGTSQTTSTLALGDVDGDGDLDMIVEDGQFGVRYFPNDGSGDPWDTLPGTSALLPGPTFVARGITLGDVDGDGDLDVVAGSIDSADTIKLYLNNGTADPWNGVSQLTVTSDTEGQQAIDLADVDQDGDLDLVVGNSFSKKLFLNDGEGDPWDSLTTGSLFDAPEGTRSFSIGDVDGDGDPDLVAPADGTILDLYLNRGGQYGFTGADAGAGIAPEGEQTSFLAATMKVNARSGDSVGRFGTMDLLFTDTGATPLNDTQANALVENLYVYRDEGSGAFEPGLDILLLSVGSLSLTAGVQTIVLPASEPNVLVAGPATFFVVGEMTTTASGETPADFKVTHLSDGGSKAFDATTGILLKPAYSPNFASQTIASVGRFVVDVTTDGVDANPGDGVCATAGTECALRAAIQEANALGGSNRIVLGPGIVALSLGGADEEAALTGDLDIAAGNTLTIQGAGAGITILDGSGIGDRVLHVQSTAGLTLEDLTIRGGFDSVAEAGDGGAGLLAEGSNTITIRRCEFRQNTTPDSEGAGLSSKSGNVVTIEDSVFHGNSGDTSGSAIYNAGTMSLINSTISGNSSPSATSVAIENAGTLTTLGSTIAGNQGGMRSTAGTVTLENTIVAANTAAGLTDDDVNTGTFTSAGHNLIGETSSGGFTDGVIGDQVGTVGSPLDARLEPLGDYHGPTLSHSLKPSSPAIDAGSCGTLTEDQRGELRPVDIPGLSDVDDGCDIGAFEAKLGQTQAPLSIPVRWCGLNGAPSIDDPSLLGETSADDVLRARHENVADNIYSDQANVSFISAANELVPAFPLLDDTMCDAGCPSVGPGSEGSIFVDPDTMDFNEFDDLIAACREEWQALDPNVTGVTAVQIDRFVDEFGAPIGILGIGGRPAEGDVSEQAAAGRVVVIDRLYRLDLPGNPNPPNPEDLLDQLLGHELGHAVSLRHGDGVDNDDDLIVDNDDEKTVGAPRLDGSNLMQYRGGTQLTAAQGAQIRAHVNATVPDVIVQPLADALPDRTPIEQATVDVLEHGYNGLSGVDAQNAIVKKFANAIVRKFENAIVRKFQNAIVKKFANAIVRRFEYAHVPQFGMAFTGTDPNTDNVILHASTGSLPWPAAIEPTTHYHFYLDVDLDDSTGAYPGDKANPSDPGRNFPGSANFQGDPDVAEEAGVDLITQVTLYSNCTADTCDSFSEKRVFDYNDVTGEYEELVGLFENDVDITARGLGLYQEIDGDYVESEDVPAGMTIQPQLPISVLVDAGWSFQPGGEPGFVRMEVVTTIECTGNIVNGDASSAAVDCVCTDCAVCPNYPGCVAGVGTPNTLGGDGTRILADCKSGEVSFEPPALPQCAISPAIAAEGASLTAYLSQLPNSIAGQTVELSLDDALLGSAPTSSIVDGALAVSVTLPAGVTGNVRVTARITGSAVGVDCIATVTPTVTCVDTDGDEECDSVDTDDDNDGVPDGSDPSPLNPLSCGDADLDTCDDCISGTNDPGNDGADFDNDGACDAFDGDDDNDGVVDGSDCAPLNGAVFAIPGEVTGLEMQGDTFGIIWDPPLAGDGGGTTVQVLSGNTGTLPVGGASEVCLGPTAAASLDDFETPAPGVVFWYLARRANVCGAGTYGTDSSAAERISAVCP